ncbi:unnamed protein product [Cuscuta epithymum]|uniref:Uncharacterized protein n=1 Tax=Cuscuta epithymum TaxID=186058 RepID=A0AAV0CSU5_9ASTE|nr:unnamed protein product [Cuscuta epithymum]
MVKSTAVVVSPPSSPSDIVISSLEAIFSSPIVLPSFFLFSLLLSSPPPFRCFVSSLIGKKCQVNL